jgi:catechol 2,3-dioxygenase-like lactoylglutathione lyase family enzyme
MLVFKRTFTSFSVDDLDKANDFYTKILGLPVTRSKEGLSVKAPNNEVFIYPKPNHQGIQFLHYDGDISTDARGIWRDNGPTIAWFTDPAGNILSVVENKS